MTCWPTGRPLSSGWGNLRPSNLSFRALGPQKLMKNYHEWGAESIRPNSFDFNTLRVVRTVFSTVRLFRPPLASGATSKHRRRRRGAVH
jgi:hypothetical protein